MFVLRNKKEAVDAPDARSQADKLSLSVARDPDLKLVGHSSRATLYSTVRRRQYAQLPGSEVENDFVLPSQEEKDYKKPCTQASICKVMSGIALRSPPFRPSCLLHPDPAHRSTTLRC